MTFRDNVSMHYVVPNELLSRYAAMRQTMDNNKTVVWLDSVHLLRECNQQRYIFNTLKKRDLQDKLTVNLSKNWYVRCNFCLVSRARVMFLDSLYSYPQLNLQSKEEIQLFNAFLWPTGQHLRGEFLEYL